MFADAPAPIPPSQSGIERDDWETPPALFRLYHEQHRFTIDVAASHLNRMTPRYFDRETDGLRQSWAGERVWLHPPHASAGEWCAKAAREAQRGTLVVGLIPARTWQPWFVEHVLSVARVRYLVGHLDWRLGKLPVKGQRKIEAPRGGFAIVEWHPQSRR